MTNQPPLNPDALDKAALAMCHYVVANREMGHGVRPVYHQYQSAKAVVSAYLAAALPEVTGEQVNLAGWTCNGIHEPGDYSTCEDCRDACDDLANFYNNMMQQPKADGPWTGRPEVKP